MSYRYHFFPKLSKYAVTKKRRSLQSEKVSLEFCAGFVQEFATLVEVYIKPRSILNEMKLTLNMFCEQGIVLQFFFFFKIFNLFVREIRSRGWGRGEGESRLPAEQGTQCGTLSQDAGIMTQAEDRHLTD